MNIIIFNVFSIALICSYLLDIRFKEMERRFSFDLVRIFLVVPLLVVINLYFSAFMTSETVGPFYLSETVFALIWLVTAYNIRLLVRSETRETLLYKGLPYVVMMLGLLAAGFWLFFTRPVFTIENGALVFPHYGALYFFSLLVLVVVLMNGWCLEGFWRTLAQKDRKQYKYLVIGFFLISGILAWSTSVRLTYLRQTSDHLILVAILLTIAWLMIGYAIAGSRLLNRKIFVSRKIVYSSVAPLLFALYLIAVGIVSLLMKTFGWPLHFILQWLLIISGLLLLVAFALSVRIRARVKYFISTHFYVNKYEYRDEWLAFSELLPRRLSEKGVVAALHKILQDSLYTDTIHIWTGEATTGFSLIYNEEDVSYSAPQDAIFHTIPPEDPLIEYLQNEQYLVCEAHDAAPAQQLIIEEKKMFLKAFGLALVVPMTIGDHLAGIIGLGPEYTGGSYGKDDFDLLAALGSQAASALLAVRTAEELASAREQSAWNILSAFVLHDIKNAATMLSLVQENAPRHIHKPEFQQDMVTSIEDALKRMQKVQTRLKTLKGEIEPVMKTVSALEVVKRCARHTEKKISNLTLDIECKQDMTFQTDPDFFGIIIENLLLNAMEATKGGHTHVIIKIEETPDHYFRLDCIDNGPGIPSEMLPTRLFDPFITTRAKGSGIGLWQVKRLMESLGGEISAQNTEKGGAQFILRFPFIPHSPQPDGQGI
ncbi:MAG: XrtA/PEP-CTERM system histidine kinase PrsK [Thermodesulfobacteriota bacterium]|nr:XrtA/PEP-CTERM system histidine kinase PrsK [Thermodesulfobacteriota bacterium]